MSEILDWQGVVALHKEEFGFEPVITGINAQKSDTLFDRVLDSIDKGIPYIEQEVPEGVLT
jgi:hypothetical protein